MAIKTKSIKNGIKITEDFVDLGTKPGKMMHDMPSHKTEVYYPQFSTSKKMKGLDTPGQVKTVKMKVRVAGVSKRAGKEANFDIELMGIAGGGDDAE